jgi:hypothetical protein
MCVTHYRQEVTVLNDKPRSIEHKLKVKGKDNRPTFYDVLFV